MAALRQQKNSAVRLLYEAYAPVFMGVINSIVKDEKVGEQVLQETFIAICSRIGIYDSTKNRFLTWGLALARGMAIQAVKTGRCAAFANVRQKCTFVETNGQEQNQQDQSPGLQHGVERLEGTAKSVFELIYLQGKTSSEAALELGLTEEELKVFLKKAFANLGAGKSA